MKLLPEPRGVPRSLQINTICLSLPPGETIHKGLESVKYLAAGEERERKKVRGSSRASKRRSKTMYVCKCRTIEMVWK